MVCQIVYPSDGVPLKEMMGLEDFLQKLKLHLMEKVIYTKANNDLVINSEELPPVIAPVLRGSVVYNSENEKKSVFLKNSVASGNYTVVSDKATNNDQLKLGWELRMKKAIDLVFRKGIYKHNWMLQLQHQYRFNLHI